MSEGKNIMIPEQNQLDNWFDKLIFEEKVKMLFGDCFLKIREIPDNSVDLIVTDPPYGINLSKGYKSGSEELVKGDDGFTIMVFVDELMQEFSRILKPNSAMYIFTRFDVYPYWWLKIKNYFETKNQIIWSKGGGGVGDLQGNYIHNYESIIYATNGKHKLRNNMGNGCGKGEKVCKEKIIAIYTGLFKLFVQWCCCPCGRSYRKFYT